MLSTLQHNVEPNKRIQFPKGVSSSDGAFWDSKAVGEWTPQRSLFWGKTQSVPFVFFENPGHGLLHARKFSVSGHVVWGWSAGHNEN